MNDGVAEEVTRKLSLTPLSFFQHQSYTPTQGHANDIGLVLLAYPYNPSNPRIRAANLPSSPNANYRSGCYISGWGMTESGSPSSTLLQVWVKDSNIGK